MQSWARKHKQLKYQQFSGFTIVELLIVIVVIAILAAISIVAYNGIQEKARSTSVVSALSQSYKKITLWSIENEGQYPAQLSDVAINDTNTILYQYSVDNTTTPASFCTTATYGSISYYISNTSNTPQLGTCSGYNTIAWNKVSSLSDTPVPAAAIDTSVYRTSVASLRLGPNSTGLPLKGSPFATTVGQTYTVELWVRSDPNWNGVNNNSKIRFGTSAGLMNACGYGGVKSSWTRVTCSYTIPSNISQLTISVGNDGTTGNIWIDDVSLSISN